MIDFLKVKSKGPAPYTTYEYDDNSNKLVRVNINRENDDLSYMLINYDANGNTIQRDYFRNKDEIFKQELYEYNYDNMMVHYVRHRPELKDKKINMVVESELNMEYDVNGMRVIKKCYPNTSDSTIYIYEGGEVVLEMTYNQIPKNKHLFTYAGGKKVSRTSFNINGTINLDSKKYYHQNFLGSIAMITDKDGNIIEHNKYEPFGDIIWSKTYLRTNNYKFTGKERDHESNLDYFNARFLDTKLGRFMKTDVLLGNIKNPQTLNKWVYCNNNPMKYDDQTGMLAQMVSKEQTLASESKDIFWSSMSFEELEEYFRTVILTLDNIRKRYGDRVASEFIVAPDSLLIQFIEGVEWLAFRGFQEEANVILKSYFDGKVKLSKQHKEGSKKRTAFSS